MRFGIQTHPQATTYSSIRDAWLRAEELGYDTAFLWDHFLPLYGGIEKPNLEAWTTLAALAEATSRIRVGTLVTGNPYRHPGLLANMACMVDQVSDGRLILGVGAGWFEEEFRQYGMSFPSARERLERLEESLECLHRLFKEDRAEFQGRHYSLAEAYCEPKPVQQPHPPILVGGGGEKVTLRLVARYADEWNGFGPVDSWRRKNEILDQWCAKEERDPSEIGRSVLLQPPEWLAGGAEERRSVVQAYANAGADHVILGIGDLPWPVEALADFWRDVVPAFR